MLPISEGWVVKVGKEAFSLDEKQILILKEAMQRSERWVSFKDFIISVPHIECIYLDWRKNPNQLQAGEKKEFQPVSKEKWEEFRKRIQPELDFDQAERIMQ